jgi:glycogen debranching enzyme
VEANWDAARRILDWARELGDADGDGYLEYRTRSPQGPKHQGWKDSDNAVIRADGSQVEPPIAPCEIQGYHHAALQFMAALSLVMDEKQNARDLWRQARELKMRFNRDFWVEEEGCVALGLDADKRRIDAVTSNAGQCITAGIVDDDKLPRLVRRLFQPDLFSGWGIRTLSTENPSYQPLSYHLGSVWAVENGTILFGLRRFGFDDRALGWRGRCMTSPGSGRGAALPSAWAATRAASVPTPVRTRAPTRRRRGTRAPGWSWCRRCSGCVRWPRWSCSPSSRCFPPGSQRSPFAGFG